MTAPTSTCASSRRCSPSGRWSRSRSSRLAGSRRSASPAAPFLRPTCTCRRPRARSPSPERRRSAAAIAENTVPGGALSSRPGRVRIQEARPHVRSAKGHRIMRTRWMLLVVVAVLALAPVVVSAKMGGGGGSGMGMGAGQGSMMQMQGMMQQMQGMMTQMSQMMQGGPMSPEQTKRMGELLGEMSGMMGMMQGMMGGGAMGPGARGSAQPQMSEMMQHMAEMQKHMAEMMGPAPAAPPPPKKERDLTPAPVERAAEHAGARHPCPGAQIRIGCFRLARAPAESRAINEVSGPVLIVSASGMLT